MYLCNEVFPIYDTCGLLLSTTFCIFRKIAAERSLFHRTMEMAANRISDLAKTIADVGTAEEELCRFEHVTYQISKVVKKFAII